MGCPMAIRWTRNWCERPVTGSNSTRAWMRPVLRQRSPAGLAGLAVFRLHDAPRTVRPVERNRQVDHTPVARGGLRTSMNKRHVGLVHTALGKRPAQALLGGLSSRHQHQTGRRHIQTVYHQGIGEYGLRARSGSPACRLRGLEHTKDRAASQAPIAPRPGRRAPALQWALLPFTSCCTMSQSSSTSLGLWISAPAPSANACCSISAVT